MYQKERLENIMNILKKYNYVTVKFLTQELHYSTATINRDLNILQNQKLVKRSYGGVELIKSRGVPFIFRYQKMRASKNKIGKKAAEFINDGDTIFIDGSTTAQYIGKYILEKKDITVITNNISLVTYLSEYGINVICLGGTVVEKPSVLGCAETVEFAMRYKADKCFFSTAAATSDGNIYIGSGFWALLIRIMIQNSKEAFYLVDHEKIDIPSNANIMEFNNVNYLISDYIFSEEIKDKYSSVDFINVGN